MSRRRWTIIVVPQGSSASRAIEVSQTALKLVGTLTVAAVVVALLLGYGTIAKSLDVTRAKGLRVENARLAGELALLQGRMSTLTDTIAAVEQRDAHVRLLANLEPIDPQVHEAGIGGPRAPVTIPDQGVLLDRASAVRVDLDALIRRATLLARSFREAADSLVAHTARLAATPSIMPTQGWLSSRFSQMREHPILHELRPHEGIDVTAPMGTPILAPANGTVVQVTWENGYGNLVALDHGNGLLTRYAHCSRMLVTVGQKVRRGQRIGTVGNSGLSTGPHLHYEVLVRGRPVNPLKYVLPDVVTD